MEAVLGHISGVVVQRDVLRAVMEDYRDRRAFQAEMTSYWPTQWPGDEVRWWAVNRPA
jgi:hypothetical protein